MIHTILADIGAQLKNTLPWVTETITIARQDIGGVILNESPEGYAGIDDRKPGRVYFRFRDGWEGTYSDARLTSGPDNTTTENLRAVFMHTCKNEQDVARFLALAIMNARNHELRYSTRVLRRTTDKQFIVQMETKQPEGTPNMRLKLVMVDFSVSYRDAVLTGEPTCIPPCHGC